MDTLDKAYLEQNLPSKRLLEERGYLKFHLPFPSQLAKALELKDWDKIDQLISSYLCCGGILNSVISYYQDFSHSEHIIAIRESETDEDGIWHDDGSRDIAFTWSLNTDSSLVGGELLFRKKGASEEELTTFTPPPKETLIIFLTGRDGYEHKVNRVKTGTRRTIAGWCSVVAPNWSH
ncbi:hypothetical protein BIY24_04880 [Halobacteriovorax marinus]|uniref:2OG-Fe(II) oxygenase n=1 Tax=Halobacteriovorax marinus TaxID=97084 RepID=UPI000BC3656E|nr:2OG-Fe(II) oxygenase [Halobacteriovorax marinus]ATH07293.1 hypothetical protein BIY24_04880 [Halobacteriovorax marinus]